MSEQQDLVAPEFSLAFSCVVHPAQMPAPPRMETMRSIAAEIAEKHGLTVEELRGRSHARRVAWPRQEAMWRMRQVRWPNGTPRFSLPQIGEFLGGRDHSTVFWGVQEHLRRLAETGKSTVEQLAEAEARRREALTRNNIETRRRARERKALACI
jgi:chromosomal replication initiation ATPase DnaA